MDIVNKAYMTACLQYQSFIVLCFYQFWLYILSHSFSYNSLIEEWLCLYKLENNICTLIQLMITVVLDDPIICDLPIKVIKLDEFLSINDKVLLGIGFLLAVTEVSKVFSLQRLGWKSHHTMLQHS